MKPGNGLGDHSQGTRGYRAGSGWKGIVSFTEGHRTGPDVTPRAGSENQLGATTPATPKPPPSSSLPLLPRLLVLLPVVLAGGEGGGKHRVVFTEGACSFASL